MYVCHGGSMTCSLTLILLQGIENKKTYELNEEEVNRIREEVGKYTTEADLVRATYMVPCTPWGQ
eukprot:1143070-Pelagomonas_calceolata.AAC.3